MNQKMTAEQRIQRGHYMLMRDPHWCLYSGIFMLGKVYIKDTPWVSLEEQKIELEENVKEVIKTKKPNSQEELEAIVREEQDKLNDKYFTAMTNGRDVWYGRTYVEQGIQAHVNGTIIHEAQHKSYLHAGKNSIYKHLIAKNPLAAKLAMEYVLNCEIYSTYDKQDIVRLDDVGMTLYDPAFHGMDTTQVFNILNNGGVGKDSKGNKIQVKVRAKGSGCSTCRNIGKESDDGVEITEEESKQLSKEIEQALREGMQLRGKHKGSTSQEFDNLMSPQVRWQDVLRDQIKEVVSGRDDYTWKPLNRRYLPMDIYLPTTYSEVVGNVGLAGDCSGSCIGKPITRFLSEMKLIAEEIQPRRIDLMYWDGDVSTPHETYEEDEVQNLIRSTQPSGRRGTTSSCIPPYIREHQLELELLIVFTDGYIESNPTGWDTISCPVIWCVVDNKNFTAPVGKVIHCDTLRG